MTAVLIAMLGVALWLARPRPLLPRDRADRMSDRWRLDHLYTHGKHGH
jgi:hypothetical protein